MARLGDVLPGSNFDTRYLSCSPASGYNLNDVQRLDWTGLQCRSSSCDAIVETPDDCPCLGNTARRRSSRLEEVRRAQSDLQRHSRASPDGLVISRIADGVRLEVNDSFVSMSGFARDGIIGKTAIQLETIYRIRRLVSVHCRFYEQESVVFEVTMRRRAGTMRSIVFSAEPMDLRGERCSVATAATLPSAAHLATRTAPAAGERGARGSRNSGMKDEFLATISHELRTSDCDSGLKQASQPRLASRISDATRAARDSAKCEVTGEAGRRHLDTARIITGRIETERRL